MKAIEIDIAVYRFIESARLDFDETSNTILKRLLGIDNEEVLKRDSSLSNSFNSRKNLNRAFENDLQRDWNYRGARLADGSCLRKASRGQIIEAVIRNGSIFVNGQYYMSPSSAAMAVNGGTSVNGWQFWEYYDTISEEWKKLSQLR